MPDLFDQLAETSVPPPPVELDREGHERVNRALVVGHVAEFALVAMPNAAWHLARAVVSLVALTFTGNHHDGPKEAR